MDLISREAAIKSLYDYHKGKKTIGQCIDDVPTIQAVPIEVLKEIKREISLLEDQVQTDAHTITAYTWKGMQDKVLEIIDSHIKEYTE